MRAMTVNYPSKLSRSGILLRGNSSTYFIYLFLPFFLSFFSSITLLCQPLGEDFIL